MQKITMILLALCVQGTFLSAMEAPEQQAIVYANATAVDNYNPGAQKSHSYATKYHTYRFLAQRFQRKITQLKAELALLKQYKEEQEAKKAARKKTIEEADAKVKALKEAIIREKQATEAACAQKIADAQKQKDESEIIALTLRNELSKQERILGCTKAQLKVIYDKHTYLDAQHTKESEELRKLKLELETLKETSAETLAHKHKMIVHHKARNTALVKVHDENTKRWSDQLAQAMKKNTELLAHMRALEDKVKKESLRVSSLNQNNMHTNKAVATYLGTLLVPYKES